MNTATIFEAFNLRDHKAAKRTEMCLLMAVSPDPEIGQLACWRPAGHNGLHWDDVEHVAWQVPTLVKTARRTT